MEGSRLQAALVHTFEQWGLPRCIKADNGAPLGDPQRMSVPVLALWLIGVGIEMVWSRPRTPRDNATVERMQATTSRWVEVEKCSSCQELQQKLDEAAVLQREKYPVKRLKAQSRKQVYPELWTNNRGYSPASFELPRVYQYLSKLVFVRKVNNDGTFNFFNQNVYVGWAHRGKTLSLHFDLPHQHFNISDDKGHIIATLQADNFSAEHIVNLTVSTYQYVKCQTSCRK